MRRFVLTFIPAAIAILGLWNLPSRATSDQTPSRSFEFGYVTHVSAVPAGSYELRLWIPLPYEDSNQSVSDLRIKAPVQHQIEREPEYKDRYAYFVLDTARLNDPFDI
jgi:hypothetical protein